MKKLLLVILFFFFSLAAIRAQNCTFDAQITTPDSLLCAGDSTTLSFSAVASPVDTVMPTPIVNNNGQDGNMFNIVASRTIRIRYFEGHIANTPNAVTQYYIYYKVGTHVGFENNSGAWTLIAGPVAVTANAPPQLTLIPVNVNITIPAGQTYAFYLTNTSAITNNNRYHNGTTTGATLSANADLTIQEGTGGAYPFGTFFNARPWEGIVHYDYPPSSYLWNTGATTNAITVQPGSTTNYSCVATVGGLDCVVEDTIGVQVNAAAVALGNDTAICQGDSVTFDAGSASGYLWCSGEVTQTITATMPGTYCVAVTDVNGCSASDSLNLTVNALPLITALGDTVCAGNAGTLLATGTGAQFTWMPGGFVGGVFTDAPASTTTYTVSTTDANGCTDSTTATLLVNTLPALSVPAFGTYCLDDGGIPLSGATPAGGTYSGPGVSNDSLMPAGAGLGTHMIVYTYTDSNSCTASDSASVTIDLCTGLLASSAANGIHVYPNPFSASTQISIDARVALKDAAFELYDAAGQLVLRMTEISSTSVTLRREQLESGAYFYRFVNDGSVIGSGKLVAE